MTEMTIAQAIKRMNKLKGRLGEERTRASGCMTHLAEQKPAYEFSPCLEKMAATQAELLQVQTAIALANAKLTIEWEGKSYPLAWAVRQLREMAGELDWLKKLPVRAQGTTVEHERDHDGEKYVTVTKSFTCHLPTASRNQKQEALQDRFDKLNDIVNTINGKNTVTIDR